MDPEDVGSLMPVFFGYAGSSIGLVLANFGAAYGTTKAGIGISAMGVSNPDAVMKNIIPVVMAGILGIYGLIASVLIASAIDQPALDQLLANTEGRNLLISKYGWDQGFKHLAAGLAVGFSSVGAGYAIGLIGDVGVKAVGIVPQLFVAMILTLILALYGLIISLILVS